MARLMRTLYSPRVVDGLFVFGAGAGVLGILNLAANPVAATAAAAGPLAKGCALLAVALAGVILAAFAIRIDQKLADDYVFQTLLKSAYVSSIGFMFALMGWHLVVEPKMGALGTPTIMCLWILTWSIGWLVARLTGTRAA
jgi:hypothetical protein